MTDTTERTAWHLAKMADCGNPSPNVRAGINFLEGIAEAYTDAVEEGWYDDDSAHDIADGAVPVYTHDLWTTFVDLEAYQEDLSDLGGPDADMTKNAQMALYMIAQRLVYALAAEVQA